MNITKNDIMYSVARTSREDIQQNTYKSLLHSVNDEPAEVVNNGEIMRWYRLNQLHRDHDQPAVVDTKRHRMEWYQRGKLHRVDKPARILNHQNKLVESWFFEGVQHRADGPAEEQTIDGETRGAWYWHGTGFASFSGWAQAVGSQIDPETLFLLKLKYC